MKKSACCSGFLVAFLFASPIAANAQDPAPLTAAAAAAAITAPPASSQVDEIIALIGREYLHPVSPDALASTARDALLLSLDPYSKYMDPVELGYFDEALKGSIGGVGMSLEPEAVGDGFRIRGPHYGSPAHAAGIRPRDVLVAVDRLKTQGRPLDDVLAGIRGEVGTTVTLDVRSGSNGKVRRVALKRGVIPLGTVLGARRAPSGEWDYVVRPDGPAYLRIIYFGETTVAEFDAALARIAEDNASGLLIDLRGNTGGVVSSAIAIADRLLDAGTIVTVRGRAGVEVHEAEPGVATRLPIALLVSPDTISSAEIFSAALQDHGRAVVVGARSYGKGAVQDIFRLAGGGAVRLTIATYERPSGRPIERHAQGGDPEHGGVWPDAGLEVQLTDDEWKAWTEAQAARDFAAPIDFGETTEIIGPDDRVLAKAIEALTALPAQRASASN